MRNEDVVLGLHKEVDPVNSDINTSTNLDIIDSINLQKDLYSILLEAEFNFEKWISKFYKYEAKYSRFFYSSISQYILQEKDDKNIAQLIQNITIVTSKITVNDKELIESKVSDEKVNSEYPKKVSPKQYLMIFKLYDHCHLASKQRIAYKATKADIEGRVAEIAHSKIAEYEKSITSQLIGLVAIFTALSFVVVGGITSFGGVFKIIETVPLAKILIILDVWFICMTNLFILFIKMIASITDRNFKTRWYLLIINTILISLSVALFVIFLTFS